MLIRVNCPKLNTEEKKRMIKYYNEINEIKVGDTVIVENKDCELGIHTVLFVHIDKTESGLLLKNNNDHVAYWKTTSNHGFFKFRIVDPQSVDVKRMIHKKPEIIAEIQASVY